MAVCHNRWCIRSSIVQDRKKTAFQGTGTGSRQTQSPAHTMSVASAEPLQARGMESSLSSRQRVASCEGPSDLLIPSR